MRIKATEAQIKQMAINAIKASIPKGMGFLHFNANEEIKPDMIKIFGNGIHIDYFHGRMVKLYIEKEKPVADPVMEKDQDGNIRQRDPEDVWILPDFEPNVEYQSWLVEYKTYRDLALSVVGIEII